MVAVLRRQPAPPQPGIHADAHLERHRAPDGRGRRQRRRRALPGPRAAPQGADVGHPRTPRQRPDAVVLHEDAGWLRHRVRLRGAQSRRRRLDRPGEHGRQPLGPRLQHWLPEVVTSAPIDPRTFRSVLGQFCTGITVITTVHDDNPVGFACQSFAALSLEPPLVLFCPTKVSRSWKSIEATGRFCANVLHERHKGKPRPLVLYRGEYTGIEPDKGPPAQWRDDLEAFLTTTTSDTWL